jgi:DNA-binding beta-propeller fold protein YncE
MRRLAPLLALAVLALALSVAGCSRRDRANPLDPANPSTGGGPTGFNAIADFGIVRLQWDAEPGLGIDGFLLERLAPADTVYRPIGSLLPASLSRFTDFGVLNGKRYQYRLRFVVGGAPGTRAATDEATPGDARVWVSDPGWPALLRLSPDGRDVAQAIGVGAPNGLAYDRASQYVWYTDLNDGQVGLYDPQVVATNRFSGFSDARELALDAVNESVWITDRQAGRVRHLYPTGASATPGSIELLDGPTGIAVDAGDRSVWICENAGGRVRHYDVDGRAISNTEFAAPWRVAVDSVTHVAWVTSLDRGLVTRIAGNGQALDTLRVASGPLGITLDRDHDRVWIADAVGDRVIVVRLSDRAAVFTVSGLHGARDIAVDRTTGEAWVVASTDHAVVRLSPTGAILQRVSGLGNPTEIRFDAGN